jgi:hypothetical protein
MKKADLIKRMKEKNKLTINIDKVHALQKVLKTKNCALTCAGRLDGIGAQCWSTISTIIAARFLGFKFIHTPFRNVDHNDLNIQSKKWNNSWENILKINSLSETNDKRRSKPWRRKLIDWNKFLKLPNRHYEYHLTDNTCFSVKQSHEFINFFHNIPELKVIINKVQTELQTAFHNHVPQTLRIGDNITDNITIYNDTENSYNEKKDCNWFEKDRVDVAIHIRKGDVIEWNITTRITENSYFMNLAKQLNKILKEGQVNYRFHIFSEGTIARDFPELKKLKGQELIDYKIKYDTAHGENDETKKNTRRNDDTVTILPEENIYFHMHLNGDARQAFIHLANADILVTCKSCFSYVAAIYNPTPNILFTTFWFPALSDTWTSLTEKGDLIC